MGMSLVSIPDRDYRGFRHIVRVEWSVKTAVSIPDRDYRGFRHPSITPVPPSMMGFQSLIGIIEDFDDEVEELKKLKASVSIPDRDYRGFRPPTSETLAVFSFQGSIATTSSNYSISALGFDNPLE